MLKLHVSPKPTPRMPPARPGNSRPEIMLGAVLLALVMAFVVGVVVWVCVR